MHKFHLAQLNIANMKYVMKDPRMIGFVSNLDQINQLAEASPGFVWRLITDPEDSSSEEIFTKDTLINLSLWQNLDSLFDFVYQSAHIDIMKHRKEWFEHMSDAYSVLWWIPVNTMPTLSEAKSRLNLLNEKGPSAQAFTFKKPFPS